MRTPLCDLLGVEYPILSVGFAAGARAELVAAVSNAGAFGVLGLTGAAPDFIRAEIERTHALTDRPFGVNIIIEADDEDDVAFFSSQIDAAGEAGAKAVVTFWGDPAPLVEVAHARGMVLMHQVGSVDDAKAAAAAGVDVVNVQGVEAGGHVIGTTSIWELIPQTVEAVSVPVVASGGIGDGAGIARALALGAQGVSLGTRFVACDEANFHPAYKQRIVEATAADTVYTEDLYDVYWPNAPHRTLRNRTFATWESAGRPPSGQRPGEGESIGRRTNSAGKVVEWPRYATGVVTSDFDGDVDDAPLWAGESVSVVNDVKPAAQIVAELVSACRQASLQASR